MARETLAGLRKRIAALEGRSSSDTCLPKPTPQANGWFGKTGNAPEDSLAYGVLPFGIDHLDAAFTKGGLAIDTLHEVIGKETRGAGATSCFAMALATRVLKQRGGALLWVCDPGLRQEAGRLNAEGLYQLGLDPARVLVVSPAKSEDGLWAMEEGLGNRAIKVVIGEFYRTTPALNLTATRRLTLRAHQQNTMALLVRHGTEAEPSAAQTRWHVHPDLSAPLSGFDAGPGRPRWQIDLNKNRDGRTGTFTLEWDHAQSRFYDTPLSVAVATTPANGQDRAATMGQVVALRPTG
ncbi:MAG: inducible mutagenesis protein A [Stappiaceae bacterium]